MQLLRGDADLKKKSTRFALRLYNPVGFLHPTSGPAFIGVKVDGKVINAFLDFHLGGTTSKFLSGFSTPAAIVVRQRAQPPEKIKHVWFPLERSQLGSEVVE